ncbi:MAG: DUF1599 domain-containing protein [Flavobacteriales bacterium]|jgi:hypothetical protein|nr:DUF1599 domain-containing protein [Flavobacteriales bacterium]
MEYNQLNTLEQYRIIVDECQELYSRKLEDYGSVWRVLRVPSLTDQLYIKAKRIRTLEESESQMIAEGIEGELIAIVNYSVMALIQLEKGVADHIDIDTEKAVELYKEQRQRIEELMMAKNHDYGEAWRQMRMSSLTDMILQKLLRIKQIEDNSGKTLVSEGMDANFHDMFNYAVFALIRYKENE